MLRPIIATHGTVAGEPIVRLTLKSGREAILDRAVYDWMVASGYSMRWSELTEKAGGYVIVPAWSAPGCLLVAARLIAGAGKGQMVRYRDRDKLNLRRANLILQEGWARRRDADYAPAMGRPVPTPLAGYDHRGAPMEASPGCTAPLSADPPCPCCHLPRVRVAVCVCEPFGGEHVGLHAA